jgi:PLP dependent protein
MPFPDLAERVAEVRERIASAVARGGHGQEVTIIAVTKTYGPDAVAAAFEAGLQHTARTLWQPRSRRGSTMSVKIGFRKRCRRWTTLVYQFAGT